MSVSMCAHVNVRQETLFSVCMYVGVVCVSLGLAPGRDCEGMNKENEEVLLFIYVFQIQIQGSQNA